MSNNRAVSETVSVVLLLAVILISATLAYTLGVPLLRERQTTEKLNSMEDGFQLVDEAIESHVSREVTEKTTTLGVQPGSIRLGNETTFTMTVQPLGKTVEVQMKPIVYSFRGTRIVYEAGAIIRDPSNGGSVILEPPNLQKQSSFIGLSIPYTVGEGGIKADEVAIRTRFKNETGFVSTGIGSLHVTISSDRDDMWMGYFRSNGFTCSSVSSRTVTCSTGASRVAVSATAIEVQFDQG